MAAAVGAALLAPAVARADLPSRSREAFRSSAAAACRLPLTASPDPAATEACAAIDGRPVSDARIAAYQRSWVHRALSLQRGLAAGAALRDQLIPHTHNTSNSSRYRVGTSQYPTLTNQDPNQVYDIVEQLDMDTRVIELDLHWVPSPYGTPATAGYWVTLCHGNSGAHPQVHIGCSWDRPAQDGFAEVAGWLDRHAGELVVLYVENQLAGDPTAHRVAGELLDAAFGDRIARPSTDCAPMDWGRTAASLAGKVVIVGDCDAGAGTAWGRAVHTRNWSESGAAGFTGCDPAAAPGSGMRRTFEDSTWIAVVTEPVGEGSPSHITPETAARMAACGVNLIGLDQLTPEDPRLAALVWSWAPGDALTPGACTYQGAGGRLRTGDCGTRRPAACRTATGEWRVSRRPVTWADAAAGRACELFSVPVNGPDAARLAAAGDGRRPEVWVAYRVPSG